MTRPPDWPALLAGYLQDAALRPFAWGRHDCATFAAGWARLMGEEIALPPEWWSAAQAGRVLRASGGLAGAASRHLPRIPPPQAWRGDIALVRPHGSTRAWLAVLDASGWRAPGARGLAWGPRADVRAAWGVGRG